jgi:predicted Zn-dependent peptidase
MENHGESTHPVAAYQGGSILVEDNLYDQAHIFIGFPAPAPNDETYPPYKILSDVLGSGRSSPLFQEVREKRGMVYSIYSTMYRHIDHSLMIISGSTTPNHIEDCIRVSCQELVKVANGQIQDHDWERARNQIFMQLAQRADKVSGIAPAIASEMFTLKRLTTIQEMYDRYSTVTKEQVIAAAKTLLASAPTVTVAGNVGEGILTADPLDIVKNAFATA